MTNLTVMLQSFVIPISPRTFQGEAQEIAEKMNQVFVVCLSDSPHNDWLKHWVVLVEKQL
jgi:hypothetical protein